MRPDLVVRRQPDGTVRVERAARWQLVGARKPEPTAEETRDQFMLGLRDQGIGPDPIVSYSDDGEAHLSWPALAAEDPELARLVALASVPLDRACPELDETPPPDPGHEAEVERQANEDRRERRLVAAAVETLVAVFAREGARSRRMERSARLRADQAGRPAEKGPPKRKRQNEKGQSGLSSTRLFEGVGTASGWKWVRAGSDRRHRARARWRR